MCKGQAVGFLRGLVVSGKHSRNSVLTFCDAAQKGYLVVYSDPVPVPIPEVWHAAGRQQKWQLSLQVSHAVDVCESSTLTRLDTCCRCWRCSPINFSSQASPSTSASQQRSRRDSRCTEIRLSKLQGEKSHACCIYIMFTRLACQLLVHTLFICAFSPTGFAGRTPTTASPAARHEMWANHDIVEPVTSPDAQPDQASISSGGRVPPPAASPGHSGSGTDSLGGARVFPPQAFGGSQDSMDGLPLDPAATTTHPAPNAGRKPLMDVAVVNVIKVVHAAPDVPPGRTARITHLRAGSCPGSRPST